MKPSIKDLARFFSRRYKLTKERKDFERLLRDAPHLRPFFRELYHRPKALDSGEAMGL